MVVAHLITKLGAAGAENQLRQLVLSSNRARFRHIVISLVDGGVLTAELQVAGIETHSLGIGPDLSFVCGFGRLIPLLRSLKPQILHGWLYHGCLISLMAAKLAGVPHVLWGLRSANPQLRGYGFTTRQIVRLCAKLSSYPDIIIVNSEASRTAHREMSYETARMTVVPNGIDVETYRPNKDARESLLQELGEPGGIVLIGMFARYSPMKDHETFLRSAALVHRNNPEVRFLLAGEGIDVQNSSLKSLIQQNKLGGVVHLLGVRRDMPRLTAGLDIACLSSWSESFPNVVAEAMACAIPCVATNVGDVAKIVGPSGIVVSPRDPKSLADAILRLIRLSPVQRQTLGCEARVRICAKLSNRCSLPLYESIYESF